MPITREELRNMPCFERVKLLTLRKHILQRKLWNKTGKSSLIDRIELKQEIKMIDEMIKLYI